MHEHPAPDANISDDAHHRQDHQAQQQDSPQGRSLEEDIHAFWTLIFEIVADLEKRLSSHMGLHGLTPPQFYVIKTLMEHGGSCRIGQIAQEHHLTNATMTGLVKRLEAMDPPLVAREKNAEDGRSVDVHLTPDGVQRFWDVQNDLMEQARAILQLLPHNERTEVIDRVRMYFHMLTNLFPIPGVPPRSLE